MQIHKGHPQAARGAVLGAIRPRDRWEATPRDRPRWLTRVDRAACRPRDQRPRAVRRAATTEER